MGKQQTTFAVATLGCKVNQADSEAIGEQMSAAGFAQRDFDEDADIYIVNTCTVTHLGDRSSRQMISQAYRRHPDALLVVTGCYAELNPQAVAALPGVDLVVGNKDKESLVETIRKSYPEKAYREMIFLGGKKPRHYTSHDAASVRPSGPSMQRALPMPPLDTQHVG